MSTTENQDARWSTWLRDVELYMDACNIDFKPQQKAVLLHLVGEQAREIYYAKAQANDDFDEVKRILSEHFTPQINIEFETFKFGELKQKDNETLDDFVVRLRTQARLCNLGNAASITTEIRKQVIRGGRCSKLQTLTDDENEDHNKYIFTLTDGTDNRPTIELFIHDRTSKNANRFRSTRQHNRRIQFPSVAV